MSKIRSRMINNIVRLQEFLSHTTPLQSAIQRMLCWHYSSPHTYAPTHVCCAESSQKFLQHISLILCCQNKWKFQIMPSEARSTSSIFGNADLERKAANLPGFELICQPQKQFCRRRHQSSYSSFISES